MGRLLEIRDLSVSFDTPAGELQAVRRVSFDLDRGETLALVGESGSGKTVTALSLVQLLPYPLARHPSGSIRFRGEELMGATEPVLRRIRGNRMAMIFQEPMTSLNPLHIIEKQVNEVLFVHKRLSRAAARARTLELLHLVGLRNAAERLGAYPHQLSGGERQRVMIAMALANEPDLLIADEPTTALDVTIQAQILQLLRNLQKELGMAVLLISHNLGVIAQSVQRVVVMYAGRKVEEASVSALFRGPRHPYTVGLLGSVPRVDRSGQHRQARLAEIPGMLPVLGARAVGCAFAPRCALATEQCRNASPPLEEKVPGHLAACWHSERTQEDAHA